MYVPPSPSKAYEFSVIEAINALPTHNDIILTGDFNCCKSNEVLVIVKITLSLFFSYSYNLLTRKLSTLSFSHSELLLLLKACY